MEMIDDVVDYLWQLYGWIVKDGFDLMSLSI